MSSCLARRAAAAGLLAAVPLLFAAGCSKSVAVAVNLVTVGCPGSPDPFALDGGSPVAFLKFEVSVDGGIVSSQTTAVASQSLLLPQLPLGTVSINVEGLAGATSSAAVVSEGNSGPFVVPDDGSVSQLSVTIFLRPTNAFSFTNAADGGVACTHMTTPRAYHSQALLPNGQVLIYGGLVYAADTSQPNTVDWTLALAMPPMVVPNTQYLGSAEVYDPQTGLFSAASAMASGDDSPSGAPSNRAFSQLIPLANGGALAMGGEFASPGESLLVPAWNGGAFADSPTPQWSPNRTNSPHAHGCLAQDTSGHALVVGGYSQLATEQGSLMPSAVITTPVGEFLDPTAASPTPKPVADVPSPSPGSYPQMSRADQACSGFDGVGTLFGGLALELGGVVLDPTGATAVIDQDYVVYQYQPATTGTSSSFGPYVVPGAGDAGGSVVSDKLLQPRARAKAAAMIVSEALDGGSAVLEDAMLVTGGFTCTPAGGPTCAPDFAAGATAGQLANPPYEYFENQSGPDDAGVDVGLSTEIISFPDNRVQPGAPAANMQIERIDHCAVALRDGRVLVLGGLGGSAASSFGTTGSAEVFSDGPVATSPPSVQSTPVPQGLLQPRAGMACTLLQDGSILVTGGFQTIGPLQGNSQPVTTLSSAEIYRPLPLAQ